MTYLDYNATTPVDPVVLDAMLPYFREHFGNAASRTHVYGWQAADAVAQARDQVARLLGVSEKEIVFTSGATESVNLALKGVFEARCSTEGHIVTVETEHKAVLDTCAHLARLGAEVTYLQPNPDGLIDPSQVEAALRPDTLLVSVMVANNETGVIQPIDAIAQLVQDRGILFHTDATQAVGKLPLNLSDGQIDLLSLSAHKLYGPKGIGALVARKHVKLTAQQDGGRHERGRRSGTLNVPGIVGLGKAAELCQQQLMTEAMRLCALRDRFEQKILSHVPGTAVNGSTTHRLPNTSNIAFANVDGEHLLDSLSELAASNGSACTSATTEPSYVLKAMGLSDDLAYASVRFSLGRFTTDDEIDRAIQHITDTVARLRGQFVG
jgi:cysteine desulfurase